MRRDDWRGKVQAWLASAESLLTPMVWRAPLSRSQAVGPATDDEAPPPEVVTWLCAESGWLAALGADDRRHVLGLAAALLKRIEWVAPQSEEVAAFWRAAVAEAAHVRNAEVPSVDVVSELLLWWVAIHIAWPLLGLDSERRVNPRAVVLYPDTFVPDHEWIDEDGIAHHDRMPHAGEAWDDGPMVLSVADVWDDPSVIVHEMAHVLDGANGAVNGFPPLAPGQDPKRWTAVFSQAYDDLVRRVEIEQTALDDQPACCEGFTGDRADDAYRDKPVRDDRFFGSGRPDDGRSHALSEATFDAYGATLPEEFFAVAVEHFFFEPARVKTPYPEVYDELRRYFRFDPERMERIHEALIA
ncbi:MAG: zinc-dependent peptidase [Thioalkalivibrionaceae bacterium]